ncbi:MAG TPA: glycosyltransferase [Candidatus Angelobacter sp.]
MSFIFLTNTPSPNRVWRQESGPHSQPPGQHAVKPKGWRVIHACEYARDVLPLVEGQVAAGMRPYIVTPRGAGIAEFYLAKKDLEQEETLSLLRAWQDVRNWRKSLLECDPENSSDLVHTHSFASGMAGVRNLPCVVYDLNGCIEELALSAGQCDRGSWMGRSFRVAEQFILSRAEAIIVHSMSMKNAVEERGAPRENVFVIPGPVPADAHQLSHAGKEFLQERFEVDSSVVVYFAPQPGGRQEGDLSPATLLALEAFALARIEVNPSRLLISASPQDFPAIQDHAQRLGIAGEVLCVEADSAPAAMSAADVVIAGGEPPVDQVQARQPNQFCLQALMLARPLLAADVPGNRDVSPDGRGCLWFKDGDARELGYRMAFLGRDPGFRATLAASGHAHILETRNSTAIGRQYDAAYRHAIKQKRSGGPGQKITNLLPITSAV